VPVLFTAAASAASQVFEFDSARTAFAIAGAALASAVVGFFVLHRTSATHEDTTHESTQSPQSAQRIHGRPDAPWPGALLGKPRNLRAALWCIPVAFTLVLAIATQAAHFSATSSLAYALLAIAVALNEEFWFRGVILRTLGHRSTRAAIYGGTALFGVLHLANLASGSGLAAASLQLVFALVFGLVAAQLTVITGSLWPAVAWHASWDFINLLSGNIDAPAALIGIAATIAMLLAYAVLLGGRIAMRQRTGNM